MDKMTIEKARENWIAHEHSCVNDEWEFDCGCYPHEPNIFCYNAKGFIEGYESRDAEINRVLKILREVENDHYNNTDILKMTTVRNVQDLIIDLLEESK